MLRFFGSWGSRHAFPDNNVPLIRAARISVYRRLVYPAGSLASANIWKILCECEIPILNQEQRTPLFSRAVGLIHRHRSRSTKITKYIGHSYARNLLRSNEYKKKRKINNEKNNFSWFLRVENFKRCDLENNLRHLMKYTNSSLKYFLNLPSSIIVSSLEKYIRARIEKIY